MTSIASDLDSPDFTGAKNPNDLLHVEFYDFAAPDVWETRAKGFKVFKTECPYVRISIPGNPHLTVERPADGQDTQKWPRQWLVFQMQTGKIANAENVPGFQIDEWDELVPDQVRNLKNLRFYTVEQIAGASDAQIQGIGMGGQGLREKAKRALAERSGAAVNEAVAQRDAKIADLEAKMERLMALMEPKDEPRKPGRPAKQAETA